MYVDIFGCIFLPILIWKKSKNWSGHSQKKFFKSKFAPVLLVMANLTVPFTTIIIWWLGSIGTIILYINYLRYYSSHLNI